MRHLSKTIAGALLGFTLSLTPFVGSMNVMAKTDIQMVADEPVAEPTYINEANQYLSPEAVEGYLAGYSASDSSVIGFFLRINEREAAAIVARGVAEGYVNLYDPNDTASITHMQQALSYVDESNLYRSWHGAQPLRIDPVLMAVSIVQTDAAKDSLVHSQIYTPYESLAVGGTIGAASNSNAGNPFDLWYWEEAPYGGSHFRNLVRPDFATTGFAVGSNSALYGGNTAVFGQTYGFGTIGTRDYSPAEFAQLLANSGSETGALDSNPNIPGTTKMYRLYNPNNGEHLYSGDTNEVHALISAGWAFEGVGWYAPDSGYDVYRLYNPNEGIHHYTMDANECDVLVSVGWQYEGAGWKSDPNQSVALYRQYNPNSGMFEADHNYTTDQNERYTLLNMGWLDEEVGWYGVADAHGNQY